MFQRTQHQGGEAYPLSVPLQHSFDTARIALEDAELAKVSREVGLLSVTKLYYS
jgi:hypothetical protein